MYFNIILQYMPRSSKKSPPLRFFYQNLYSFFSCPICATCHYQFYVAWFDRLNGIWWAVQMVKLQRWIVSRVIRLPGNVR